MSIEYFGLLMYDFPMQTDVEIFEYRTFRKKLIEKGCYQLQKSVYIMRSKTKFLNPFHYPDRRSVSKNEGTCRRSDNGRKNFTK